MNSSDEQGNTLDSIAAGEFDFFDGTFAYWLLAGVHEEVSTFKLNTWKNTPKGLKVGFSPVFTIVGQTEEKVGEKVFQCSKITATSSSGITVINYVSREAPYFIKQEYPQGDQPAMTVLTLQEFIK